MIQQTKHLKRKDKNGLKCGVRFVWNDKFVTLHLHLQEQVGRQEVNLSPVLEQILTQEADFI